MAEKAINVYLNDHLTGATLGSDLTKQTRNRYHGAPLGALMGSLAPGIDQDRKTLLDLMEKMGRFEESDQAGHRLDGRKGQPGKFSGSVSGEPDHGAFMALETLTLGVEGKASLLEGAEGSP